MADRIELRSGKKVPESGDNTPESGLTTSTETNTWSKGTGTEVEGSVSGVQNIGVQQGVDNATVEAEPVSEVRSATGTVVNVGVGIGASESHISVLKAELEVYNAEYIKAQAASAIAKNRLEIARSELARSSDAAPPLFEESSRIAGWISEQRIHASRPAIPARDTPRVPDQPPIPNVQPRVGTATGANDMTMLANAIVMAVNSNKNNDVPKFIRDLPHFDGSITEWMSFKSVYDDTEKLFTGVQNVARLRQSLRGAAREAVRALLYTVTDPYEVIDSLERRFGRPEILILTELENVKRMPRLADDGRNIASFASRVANTVAAIRSLNQPQYLYSPELVNRVVDKLNMILKYKWFEYKSQHSGSPELVMLSRFLNSIGDQCGAMFAYEAARDERKSKPKPRVNTAREWGDSPRPRTYSNSSGCTESESEYENAHATVATLKKSQLKKKPEKKPVKSPQPPNPVNPTVEPKDNKCVVCEGSHSAVECADFKKLSVSDRWEAAKRFRLCFRCLGDSHRRPIKCKYVPCGTNGCEASHHKLLHGSDRVSVVDSKKPAESSSPNRGSVSSVNHLHQSSTYLKIIPVEISGPLGTVTTYALLDEGSSLTLVERGVADEVVPRGPHELLSLEGVGGNRLDDELSCRIKVSIRGLCNRSLESMNAFTIGQLNLAPQTVDRDLVKKCSHLAEIEDELCYERAKPTILIGQDNWHLITSRQLKIGGKYEPVASFTKLGWVLHGRGTLSHNTIAHVNHVRPAACEDKALALIRDFFSIESLGIEARKPTSDPDQRALAILDKTCRKLDSGDRYEAGLLWKSDNEVMPDNRKQALSRLFNLEAKLDKNIEQKIEYTKQVDNLIKNGYAERADAPPTSPRTWYLPHFSVIHPQKGKVRLVFDAAAKSGGKSLNDALLSGPDLLQSLFGVLVRFREGKIGAVSDIREMFLQVKITENDRDSLRFLWRGEDRVGPPLEYRMNSLIFGAASSPCTAIYVKNKNAESHGQEFPEVARATVRNFYMDDYLGAFNDPNEARRVINSMQKVHMSASFELRGWASNVPEVISDVTNTRSSDSTTLGKSDSERTLGLLWNHKRDTLGFNVNLRNTPECVVSGNVLPTKRQITSAVMSVFDPLGLVSPITMVGKALIQEVWRSGISWDDPISAEHNVTWLAFVNNLQLLKHLEVERYVPAPAGEACLHIFCDASEKVYAAAVYVVSLGADGIRTSRLVAGKAKVAPLRPISIPRLELQSAVLGSRLASSVKHESDYIINKCHYWSDSKTVLAWIKSDPRTFKSFVAHRLAEIESLTSPADWRWVPSAENVADDATKGIPANFDSKHRWFSGPTFIRGDPETWPKEKQVSAPPPPSGEERIIKPVLHAVARQAQYLPKVERFSKYTRLLHATATVLLAAEVFKAILLKKNCDKEKRIDHVKLAELLLIRRSQDVSFREEIANTEAGRPISKKSRISKLAVEVRNGVLYLDSRFTEDRKQRLPILHANEAYTRLLVQHTHSTLNHGNHNTVLNELQQKFHIIGLRSALRYICNKCQWCRTYKGTTLKVPMGDLPIERLSDNQPPFTATAVDYFGPMQITVGRRHEKRWGALYTCLTTRAVHLEVATSLSASSMILTLRRMMARRGAPTVIYSDNGTNFRGAEREIAEAIDDSESEMNAFAASKAIVWKKIPPGAPSMGGAWERLIRSIKTALKVTLKEKFPSEEVLHTLILEAEHLVNSRPLTPVNPNLTEEALTPNHFLIGRSCGMSPFGSFSDTKITQQSWRSAQAMADVFWSRWLKEYKPLLKTRRVVQSAQENVKVGDIVLIVDQTMPRGTWPRGEVISVYPGPDGRVRITEIRTAAGLIRRPASRLVIIT